MRHFDALVIGAGQAGPPLAARLAGTGRTVALVERHLIGGTCVNTGCTPTKTLIASAHAAHMVRRAADYGVVVEGAPEVDLAAAMARKNRILGTSRTNLETWLAGVEGLTVLRGHARLTSARTADISGETVSADMIFLNVGGRAVLPDVPGLHTVPVLTNTSILEIDTLPEHLVIVGGSYVALEFAQMFRRFGSAVTVLERGERLIGREDEETSDAVRDILGGEGIAILTGTDLRSVERSEGGVLLHVEGPAGASVVTGSHLLMAVGRRPNTDDLGLDAAGVRTDGRGFITVDDRLETSAPGIFALGDCNGRGAFTHTSYNDFEIVAANLLDGGNRRVTDRIPAYALYIDPPLGRVGMTEAEARKDGRKILVGRRPMTRVSRAVEKGEDQGFMKVVVDADSRKILGAAILGVGGDEAVHGILNMMYADVPYTTLANAVPIHPTVSELIPTVLGEMKPAT